jgi:hypothetical protein
VADDIADDQHGGVLRPLSHQVEVAADLFGGRRQEGRGKVQAGTLGQLGRRQRIPDRAQILQFMLGRLQALTQRREIPRVNRGLCAKAGDQRLLAVVALIHVADLAFSGVGFGVQPPQLHVLLVGQLAHDTHRTLRRTPSRAARHPLALRAQRRCAT